MNNEIKWKDTDNTYYLFEQGLNLSKRSGCLFSISSVISIMSLIWVVILSIRLIIASRQQEEIPPHYFSIGLICLFISLYTLYKLYTFYREKKAYRKEIVIKEGLVTYSENKLDSNAQWTEKLKKYDGLFLKHFNHRGTKSWYIAFVHKDTKKSFPVFVPTPDCRNLPEDEKKQVLARYGTKFNIQTVYEPETKETSTT